MIGICLEGSDLGSEFRQGLAEGLWTADAGEGAEPLSSEFREGTQPSRIAFDQGLRTMSSPESGNRQGLDEGRFRDLPVCAR